MKTKINFSHWYNCLGRGVLTGMLLLLIVFNISSQSKYEPPKLTSEESWSMILIPDPQTYIKFGRNQPLFELMTAWISENIDALNIEMVVCLGDLVEQNEIINPDGKTGNQSSKQQWESVSRSLYYCIG